MELFIALSKAKEVTVKLSDDKHVATVKIPSLTKKQLGEFATYLYDNYDGSTQYRVKGNTLTMYGNSPDDIFGKAKDTKKDIEKELKAFLSKTNKD